MKISKRRSVTRSNPCGLIEMMAQNYFVGLDLGQAQDFTALAVLARSFVLPGDPSALRRCSFALRHLQRFPLGTHYSEVLGTLVKLLQAPPLVGAFVVVDQTGVGRAVVDTLADGLRNRVTCLFCPVTITTGQEVTTGLGGSLRVPKKELVGILQVLLQNRRLQVARKLPEAQLLLRELENFRMKVINLRPESLETWREGHHDDLVLAVALAAWVGEQVLPPVATPAVPQRLVT
jgi:hypothetical protein